MASRSLVGNHGELRGPCDCLLWTHRRMVLDIEVLPSESHPGRGGPGDGFPGLLLFVTRALPGQFCCLSAPVPCPSMRVRIARSSCRVSSCCSSRIIDSLNWCSTRSFWG